MACTQMSLAEHQEKRLDVLYKAAITADQVGGPDQLVVRSQCLLQVQLLTVPMLTPVSHEMSTAVWPPFLPDVRSHILRVSAETKPL